MRRNTPHRPDRENPQRERNDLRTKNRVLTRQVARLRKEVDRLGSIQDEGLDPEPMIKEKDDQAGACPLCGSHELRTFTVPVSNKVLLACTSCKKYRAVVQEGLK